MVLFPPSLYLKLFYWYMMLWSLSKWRWEAAKQLENCYFYMYNDLELYIFSIHSYWVLLYFCQAEAFCVNQTIAD